jgi:hypothetical protein
MAEVKAGADVKDAAEDSKGDHGDPSSAADPQSFTAATLTLPNTPPDLEQKGNPSAATQTGPPAHTEKRAYSQLVGSESVGKETKAFVQFLAQAAAVVWRSEDPQFCWLLHEIKDLKWTNKSDIDKKWKSHVGIQTAALIDQALEFIKLHANLSQLPRLSTHILHSSLCVRLCVLLSALRNANETRSNGTAWPKSNYDRQREQDLHDLRRFYGSNAKECV